MMGRRELKASFVVETAAIFPVLFLVLMVSVYVFFYYHDKVILTGAAYETAVAGSEKMRLIQKPEEEELEKYFLDRVRRKLIFFGEPQASVSLSGKEVVVEAQAYRRRMHLSVRGRMAVTEPEPYLRSMKQFRKRGGTYENNL